MELILESLIAFPNNIVPIKKLLFLYPLYRVAITQNKIVIDLPGTIVLQPHTFFCTFAKWLKTQFILKIWFAPAV